MEPPGLLLQSYKEIFKNWNWACAHGKPSPHDVFSVWVFDLADSHGQSSYPAILKLLQNTQGRKFLGCFFFFSLYIFSLYIGKHCLWAWNLRCAETFCVGNLFAQAQSQMENKGCGHLNPFKTNFSCKCISSGSLGVGIYLQDGAIKNWLLGIACTLISN